MHDSAARLALAIGVFCLMPLAYGQLLTPPPVPPENPITDEKRILGKILFWEEQLSSDDAVACGTCHIPAAGGSDPRLTAHPGPDQIFGTEDDTIGSAGIVHRDTLNQEIDDPIFGPDRQVTGRASPTILMSMFADEIFWDGRAGSSFSDPLDPSIVLIPSGGALENQSGAPILSTVEMAHEGRTWADVTNKLAVVTPLARATRIPPDMAAALNGSPSYAELFEAAFGDPTISPARIAMAIATYERTLVPDQTPWDLFMAGDTGAMTDAQIQGWTDFSENTVCDNCHTLPDFTDHQFYNIGLRPAGEDPGRQTVTQLGEDFGRFKTPSLRNVGLRKAQMHVGWITDVQDAVDFYNAVSGNTGHTQFLEDQSGIPTNNPGFFVDYSTLSFFVPSPARQLPVIDFMENGLTDPRVAAEEFPFDRPILASETLEVMTYNVMAPGWTTARADIVADVIRQQDADVVGLQEALSTQQNDLIARLGDVYDLETFDSGGASSPVLLKKNVFSVVSSGSSTVPLACNNQGFVNFLVLEHKTSAELLIVHNSHFCATIINFPAGEPTATERNQAHAATLVDTILDNQATWGGIAIALGDFNSRTGSQTIRFLLEQAPLPSGAGNPVVLSDTWGTIFPGANRPPPGLDWIVTTTPGVTVLDAAVISNTQTAMASDHEPVVTTVAIDTTARTAATNSDLEAPTVPTNLRATTVTDSLVGLAWDAAADNVGVTAYRVYRDGSLLITSASAFFTDSSVATATDYVYSVTALDAAGNESFATDVSVTTLQAQAPPPPAPAASSGGGGGGSLGVWLLLLLGAANGIRSARRARSSSV